MAFSLTWLRQVLLDQGLKVAEQPGWIDRGRAEMGEVKGVMCHHTAGPAKGNMPSLGVITNGRSDLPGPLCQLGLGRDGTFYLVAAGRANHAGAGSWKGITTGNSNFIGIEAENMGTPADPWPNVQLGAYRHGVAAILKRIGADASMCCGHKEYALPAGRKDDPDFDMDQFRSDVAAIMAGNAPTPSPIPANAGQATVRRGDVGDEITALQKSLNLPADGKFNGQTEAAVRDFQRLHQLVPDGIVGPKTWVAINNV
jgi:N-acetylmuramoyl-L-alanine amidase/Putative peptidoglycan binding domain